MLTQKKINELAEKFSEARADTARDFEIDGVNPDIARRIWKLQAAEVLTILSANLE